MRYRITHRTSYRHSETVPLCQNALWLTPREENTQRREFFRLEISPTPSSCISRTDYFGNEVTYFTIDAGYRTLEIVAMSEMVVLPRVTHLPDSPPWEQIADGLCRDLSEARIAACQFRFDSPFTSTAEELADYARQSFAPRRPIAEATRDLTSRIHADFRYEPGATTVNTSVSEVFGLRRGVCQDFAHIEIACLRSLGLAARYVSGYLRTHPSEGSAPLVGSSASHAWLSVFCGDAGWVDFDPTNDLIPSTDHVMLAWGRDYGDVTPVRGLFVGGGRHEMEVNVEVVPMDE